METKKTLKIDAALCDVRNVTEELLSIYEKVKIDAAAVITSPAAQLLLGKYAVEVDAASSVSLDQDVAFSCINGPMVLSGSQPPLEKKQFLIVNGPLTLEPGCEEALKNYVGMVINGPVTCPDSLAGMLGGYNINGPVSTYPDGSIVLKKKTVLDRFFQLRAKQGALYYASRQIAALSPDIDFARLAEKNVRFVTKTLLVSESLAEAAVPLFDDRTEIVVLPDGCAYVDDDAELSENLLKRYGGKLYISGDLMVTPDSAAVLDQVSWLRVRGSVLVCRSLRDRFLSLDAEYEDLRVVGGLLLRERGEVEVSAAMLENAAEGVSVTECATVRIAEDASPELLREKLVSIVECANVICTPEQRPVVEEAAREIANIVCGGSDEEGAEIEEDAEDKNVVHISAASYTL